jgi:hypothetical protein
VPDLPFGLLIAGGLIFSMANAAVEEGVYRGVFLHALDTSIWSRIRSSSPASPCLWGDPYQRISARLDRRWPRLHLRAALGNHPATAGGMFAPWIAHVFTDVIIAGIVVFLARPT